jgi:hypothetical protein
MKGGDKMWRQNLETKCGDKRWRKNEIVAPQIMDTNFVLLPSVKKD